MKIVPDLVVLERFPGDELVAGIVLDQQDVDGCEQRWSVVFLPDGVGISSGSVDGTGRVNRKRVPSACGRCRSRCVRRGARRSSCTAPDRCRCRCTRPRPCSRWKITKTLSANSSAIPMPLSETVNSHSGRRRGSVPQSIDDARRVPSSRGTSPRCRSGSATASPAAWGRRRPSGSGLSGRSISAPDSSIAVARLSSAVSSAVSRSTSVWAALSRPTREKVSRSLISACIRLAPSTAKAMYSVPRSSSLSP